jgi:hypothetical protein
MKKFFSKTKLIFVVLLWLPFTMNCNIADLLGIPDADSIADDYTSTCNYNGYCDTGEDQTNCYSDCYVNTTTRYSPEITEVSIVGITSNTVDVSVTANDPDGIYYIEVGAFSSDLLSGNYTSLYYPGTSQTYTITHNASAGTELYGYALLSDYPGYFNEYYFNPSYSSSNYFENSYDVYGVSGLPLSSALVP